MDTFVSNRPSDQAFLRILLAGNDVSVSNHASDQA